MFSKDVAAVLDRHRMLIYHAHHLLDVRHYLHEHALLSRELLTQQSKSTQFFTDDVDKIHGVFDAVFFNMRDLGAGSKHGRGIGNSYGPILFVLRPVALAVASETIVSTQPISKLGQNEALHEINTIDEFEGIFVGNTKMIIDGFSYTELICRVPSVPLTNVFEIVVDPVIYGGKNLVEIVRTECNNAGLQNVPVRERNLSADGKAVFADLVDWVGLSRGTLDRIEDQSESIRALYQKQGSERMMLYAGRLWESTMSVM